jgi:RES domain-containing protein
MVIYRIARADHIRDLSGIGPRLYGGRWNPKGISVVYASESRALAALEFYVHLSRNAIPPHLAIASIEILDKASRVDLRVADLPRDWRTYPAPRELAAIGAEWVRSGKSLLLRVPSAVMPPEYNILINPAHPESKGIRIARIEQYTTDHRLLP